MNKNYFIQSKVILGTKFGWAFLPFSTAAHSTGRVKVERVSSVGALTNNKLPPHEFLELELRLRPEMGEEE